MADLLPYVLLVAFGVAVLGGGIWLGMLLGRRLDRALLRREEEAAPATPAAEEDRGADG